MGVYGRISAVRRGHLRPDGLDFSDFSFILVTVATIIDKSLHYLVKLPCIYGLMALGLIVETLIDLPFLVAISIDNWVQRRRDQD